MLKHKEHLRNLLCRYFNFTRVCSFCVPKFNKSGINLRKLLWDKPCPKTTEKAHFFLCWLRPAKKSKVNLWSDRVDQIKRKGNSSKNKFTEITFFISLYFVPASTLIFFV